MRRDPRVHLVPGQLAALAGLGSLRHLDLHVVGVGQVVAGHAEPPAGHLLDRGAAQVTVGVAGEAVRVLAALAGVGPAAKAVHRDGQRLVRLGGDRPVGHGAGGEPPDDARRRFDLLDRDRLPCAGRVHTLDAHQAAQRHQPRRLVVDQGRVLLEDLVPAAARGVLQLEDGLRAEQVRLALAAPLVLAADLQPPVRGPHAARREGADDAAVRLGRQHVEADAAEPRGRALEAGADDLLAESGGLEDLRAGVGGDGGHAHLGHDLQHALAERLDQAGGGLVLGHALQHTAAGHVTDRLDGQVGSHRGGAVADQQGDVMAFAGVAGLHDQAHLGAGLLPDQVMVHRAGEQQ